MSALPSRSRRRFFSRLAVLLASASFVAGTALAASGAVQIIDSQDPALKLGTVSFPDGKTVNLTVGIGSSLYHAKADPKNVFWSITDRGANIDCGADVAEITGLSAQQICMGDDKGKLFPFPAFTPSISKIAIEKDGTFKILQTIKLADAAGKPITGLSNPLKAAKTEKAYGIDGKQIAFDPNGLDTEGLVRLQDKSFWVGEEYAPSLVHIAADGRILERLVPTGIDQDLAGATYPVKAALPAILAKRQLNRGIEGIALSPDEKYLYAIVQNPLANPDAAAYKQAIATRLIKIDRAREKVIGEYVYTLDDYKTFPDDKDAKQESDVRISELMAVGSDRLVVLERIANTTKLNFIEIGKATNILATAWDDAATSPSLEQLDHDGLAKAKIAPVKKKLWQISSDHPGMPGKLEGMALVGSHDLYLINDDDFGISGDHTRMVHMTVSPPKF
ncbi:MAG TPA: esterase-like activity of phytase family protein [Dongiaceae bacterium]|nr:esterase-like activity of phytase family protein [Dongiaceae bacterium]